MSWRTLMSYFVLSGNGKESFNTFLSPNPDQLRGALSYGYIHFCIKKSSHADRQTNKPKCTTLELPSGSEGNNIKHFTHRWWEWQQQHDI